MVSRHQLTPRLVGRHVVSLLRRQRRRGGGEEGIGPGDGGQFERGSLLMSAAVLFGFVLVAFEMLLFVVECLHREEEREGRNSEVFKLNVIEE